ncbi:hypothetical protein DSCO28_29410 [Desulfosarcina ovata subsp. sediminis]|uniref:4Fe4S-binding SPASM domain-containing protein n=1 Tax=Desulfosarcina ovata subsp. sediminis TaxID=885957 RepID=A0A5K7ZNY5_9BACT|nr:SPASM domain-containing protein [Desulfosarcina ovata]BBO82375.1 hypothetical protein DSCO28_29410 [Desulfosarcina ovata subsp. sediminis]
MKYAGYDKVADGTYWAAKRIGKGAEAFDHNTTKKHEQMNIKLGMLDFLIPLWDREASPYPCGKRIATVFPDGTVGSCIREHSFKSGSIFDDDPITSMQCATYHYEVIQPDIPAECHTCEVKEACQGGCPRDKLLLTGSRSGKSIFCDVHREIIPRLRAIEALKRDSAEG